MPDFLLRFVHDHQAFRRAEVDALAELAGLTIKYTADHVDTHDADIVVLDMGDNNATPYWTITAPSIDTAVGLVRRSILICDVYELWGQGETYEAVHDSVKHRLGLDNRSTTAPWQHSFSTASFWFVVRSFHGKRSQTAQRSLIDSFSYLPLKGPIRPSGADVEFCVLERFVEPTGNRRSEQLLYVHFGRLVGSGSRPLVRKYDLKKRAYISTTSMDAQLALLTANIALAGPGKLVYDPFLGTAGFPIACAAFGATTFGSDIDGRSFRGEKSGRAGPGRPVVPAADVNSNFVQYETTQFWLDPFSADLTNTPIRKARLLDAVVCDPPYGVREGIKVLGLGTRQRRREENRQVEPDDAVDPTDIDLDETQKPVVLADGTLAHLNPGYVAPKRAYSLDAMMADLLAFSVGVLVDDGRLAIWIPAANDSSGSTSRPHHPALAAVSESRQDFNKWSRRLVVYRRIPDDQVDKAEWTSWDEQHDETVVEHGTADELNEFRKKYFRSFRPERPTEMNNVVVSQ